MQGRAEDSIALLNGAMSEHADAFKQAQALVRFELSCVSAVGDEADGAGSRKFRSATGRAPSTRSASCAR